jgi:hypothetical protein
MQEKLSSALEQPHPVVILAASLADLPAEMLRVLPPAWRFAPLSRDVMMAHLCVSHGAMGHIDAVLREKLPQNRDMARLTWPMLAVALRAPLAKDVVQRLHDLTQNVTREGPSLADIEGYGAAEAAARRMVADLQGWFEGRVSWRDVQRSVLFHGVPGSAGVALVRGSFAKWQAQGHLGHMLKAMRNSFVQAAQQRPAILVIDEIDAVGDRADVEPHNARYQLQVINGFLEEMDQLKHLEGVLVVGTCNYPDKIDAAVLRPGRFDIKVEVPLPGAKALARMLRDGLEGDVAASDLACLTRAAAGQSAADVDGALRQARSVARAEARDVRVTDVLLALNPDPHECGHAIVATSLGVGQIRRLNYRGQGGQTWIRFTSGEGLLSECEAELAYHLAGRAAERLILESVTAGSGGAACSDLARATLLAVRIDAQFGLGAEGLAWHDISTSQYLREPKNAARIRARLEAAEDRAMQVLKSQRAVLVEMSEDLQQNRLLEDDALKTWLAKVTRSQALTHL